MTARPIRLPAVVHLRTAPALPAGEVHEALGVSRQLVHVWRRNRGFPASEAGLLDTAAVAAFLARNGARVVWA